MPDLIAAQDAAGRRTGARRRHARRPARQGRPTGGALAAWSLVHGFSLLWLNEAIDTDDDPIATVERVALMLFDTVACEA